MEATRTFLSKAAEELGNSVQGRGVMTDFLALMERGGLALGRDERMAFLSLVMGAFGNYPWIAGECMRVVLERATPGTLP